MTHERKGPAGNGADPQAKNSVSSVQTLYRDKPVRRTKKQVEQLERQIIEVLEEDHPQSIRHVFYCMTDPRLPEPVEKSDKGYVQVQNRCARMRRAGRLPYHWIADTSRHGYYTNTFDSASDFILSMEYHYRADLWREADWLCQVWCESRSIASTIRNDCSELAVDLYPCGGFPSMTFAHEAAMQHNRLDDLRPLQVFYIGDYDPAGVLIDASLERELRLHLNDDIELRFDRIGINREQIIEYDLPTKPRKRSDKRSSHVLETVEAEAMPAHVMRDLLRQHIESLLPANALTIAEVSEQNERDRLMDAVDFLMTEGDES